MKNMDTKKERKPRGMVTQLGFGGREYGIAN
jgi:hypothetical protein